MYKKFIFSPCCAEELLSLSGEGEEEEVAGGSIILPRNVTRHNCSEVGSTPRGGPAQGRGACMVSRRVLMLMGLVSTPHPGGPLGCMPITIIDLRPVWLFNEAMKNTLHPPTHTHTLSVNFGRYKLHRVFVMQKQCPRFQEGTN